MQEWWAFELERDLILKYKDHGLCNRTDGGEGASGTVVSEETRAKHRAIRWSEKWRRNLSDKAKERFSNPEYKQAHKERQNKIMANPRVKDKIRQSVLKYVSTPEARERARRVSIKHFSNPEARKIARDRALARFDTPEKRSNHAQAKALRCIDNGMIFGTTTLAAEWVTSWKESKADNSQIAKACRGIIKSAYGLRWEYIKTAMEAPAA
jgi:hypothetical protein